MPEAAIEFDRVTRRYGEIRALDGDLGFVRGWTTYTKETPPKEYGNLWVVRLADDGRASEYTEWWVRVRDTTPPFPD